ncbi:serine/threonine-protein kinase [Glycomyces sp. NPDC047369]
MQPLSRHDPTRVGPYRVVAELGHGAMGRVLLGFGPDGRWVAVKLVRDWLAEDGEFRARFRREIASSRRVTGEWTAPVLDADPDAPIPWLASAFLPGPTLQEAVDAAGGLPEQAVLRLAAGLASALADIHAAGVIHRDLKPGNVILTREGPRIIDFGIARAAVRHTADLTRTGGILGTPGFMSPEQADSAPLTTASDVFSLGSVLVLAATGSAPFEADSTLRTLNNVVRADPDLSAVPERVRTIARACFASDPARRPTATDLLAATGPTEPAAAHWPEPVVLLARKQHRELTRLVDASGPRTTRIDDGPTMVTGPDTRSSPVHSPPALEAPAPPAGLDRFASPVPPPSPSAPPSGVPAARPRRRFAAAFTAVVAAAVLAIVLLNLPDEGEGAEGGDPDSAASEPETTGEAVDGGLCDVLDDELLLAVHDNATTVNRESSTPAGTGSGTDCAVHVGDGDDDILYFQIAHRVYDDPSDASQYYDNRPAWDDPSSIRETPGGRDWDGAVLFKFDQSPDAGYCEPTNCFWAFTWYDGDEAVFVVVGSGLSYELTTADEDPIYAALADAGPLTYDAIRGA